jgi:Cu+-exporting ATPase
MTINIKGANLKNHSSEFNLQNIKCAGCVNKIENRLREIAGISFVAVSLLDKILSVKYTNKNLDSQVIEAVQDLGYGAAKEKSANKKMNPTVNIGLPLILGLVMMTFGMTEIFMPDLSTLSGFKFGVLESLITLLTILFTGRSMFKSGINGFRTLNLNMYSLIILGVSSAWVYSTWVVINSYFMHQFTSQHIYFESALIITGLINLGSYLEDKARANTTTAIKSLIALQPDKTTIVKNKHEQIIRSDDLTIGDIIKIRPGERIPADGMLVEGESHVDESMLTGEPLAVYKKIGDNIIAGSINTQGSFLFEAHKVGDDTLLSEIIQLVKSAQMSKPKLAQIANSVAKIFIPMMILIAIISALIWWFLGPQPKVFYTVSVFMTILLIACPCSVGLAIPVALMVGLGKSATKGILIRDTSCLSNIDKLDYVLLDKTGTITEGRPTVMAIETATSYTVKDILYLVKSLESKSSHPLASAILNCQLDVQADLLVEDFLAIGGCGIQGKINGETYYVGSKEWISGKLQINSSLFIDNHFTQMFLSDGQNILARIDIGDAIKPDSENAIKQLRQNGMKVAMVTGDSQENAKYIATLVGLDAVYANCKPQDKIDIIKKLQGDHVVAFVGDGINDAPGLVQADVGIAMGSGIDAALQSAGIILMRSSLVRVNDAIIIGRAINKNMKQNLFGSFVYNVIAVLVAAGVFYPLWHVLLNPIIASIAMSLSSITVILNALRLRQM